MKTRWKKKGFTLLELVIVILVTVLVLVVVIVPRHSRKLRQQNEIACMRTLHTLDLAQLQFQPGTYIDQDGDGTGEFGVFNELAGFCVSRYKNRKMLQPGILPADFIIKDKDASVIKKSGYCFQIFIPGKNYVTDIGGTTGIPVETDGKIIDAQENQYRFYAWPMSKSSGTRCFSISDTCGIMGAQNLIGENIKYVGNLAPHPTAALGATETSTEMDGIFKIDGPALDGQVWYFVTERYND